MADPLDDVRRALGIPVAPGDGSPYLPQEAGAPPLATGTSGPSMDTLAAQHEARARVHEEERRRLHEAGDDADGLQELRRAFRRMGRG